MAQDRETPIYWDQSASKWNLTLIFSLVVVVLGIAMGPFGQGFLLVVLGIVMAAYSWLTTPRQFLLYRDSLLVVYGMPRTRHISFAEISHVELLALPFGERLRLRMVSGSRMMLMMRDPGAFRAHLEDALAQYHGEQSSAAFASGTLADRRAGEEFEAGDQDYTVVDDPVQETGLETRPETGTSVESVFETERRAESGSSGTYTEPAEAEVEAYTGRAEQAASVSGSYTEAPEPDFSGEGRSMYGAEVEFETSSDEDGDSSDRPPSPY